MKISRHIIGSRPPLSPLLADAFPQLLIVVNTAQCSHCSLPRSVWSAKYLPDQGQGQLTGQCLHPRRYLTISHVLAGISVSDLGQLRILPDLTEPH